MTDYFIEPLRYTIHDNGSIDLQQDFGTGDIQQVYLHPMHVRILFEEAGHLLPNPPVNEMLEGLARWLLEIRAGLRKADAQRYSPELARLYDRIDAYCETLPKQISRDEMLVHSVGLTTSDRERPAFELAKLSAKGDNHG